MEVSSELFKFERGVMSHVLGTLLAWSLALIAYLTYKLWQDYISTILTAFIVSQTLHKQRAQIVGQLRWMRGSNSPSLVQSFVNAASSPAKLLHGAIFDVPSIVQLAIVQLLFVIEPFHQMIQRNPLDARDAVLDVLVSTKFAVDFVAHSTLMFLRAVVPRARPAAKRNENRKERNEIETKQICPLTHTCSVLILSL